MVYNDLYERLKEYNLPQEVLAPIADLATDIIEDDYDDITDCVENAFVAVFKEGYEYCRNTECDNSYDNGYNDGYFDRQQDGYDNELDDAQV